MRKLLKQIPRLSRKQRIVRNLVCCLLLLVLCWYVMGAEPFLPRWAFRWVERAEMLGPSEILDVVRCKKTDGDDFYLVVAEDQWGYSVFGPSIITDLYGVKSLLFQEKQENVNLVIPHSYQGIPDGFPLVLFTQLPAVRAQVQFELGPEILDHPDLKTTVSYCLDAELREDGYFLFLFSPSTEEAGQRQAEYAAMNSLAYWSDWGNLDNGSPRSDAYQTVVRLWDENNTLIYEKTLKCGFEVIENEN